jgi:multisubunit Na+/H+ antiporter MnhF subunit
MTEELAVSEHPVLRVLQGKIGWLCQAIRWLMVAYVVWVLYRVLEPILISGAAFSAKDWATYWGLKEGSIEPASIYWNRGFALISWLSAFFLGLAVWRLMSSYLGGDVLSSNAAGKLRWVGVTGLVATLVDIAIRPAMLGVLSTEIFAKVNWLSWVDPIDLMYFLISLFVLSLGHVQHAAAVIAEEHKQFL